MLSQFVLKRASLKYSSEIHVSAACTVNSVYICQVNSTTCMYCFSCEAYLEHLDTIGNSQGVHIKQVSLFKNMYYVVQLYNNHAYGSHT